MPLTPADVHHVAFSRPPLGKRGYHEDEVDAFLDLVGAELARLMEENKDLRNQVERLDRPLQLAEPVVAPVPPPRMKQISPGGDHHVQAAKVLGLAQEIADRLTGEAQTEADAMLRNARNNSAQLLSQARVKADGMVDDARTRAETMLHDARTRAETLDRQSRDKAASLERDAARKHTEIIGSISQEKTILEKKIDQLRAFEREYRTRLTIYLDAQLRELNERGAAAPAAGATRSSVRGEAPDTGIRDEPGTSRTPWKPAVELQGVRDRGAQQWPPVQRSVS